MPLIAKIGLIFTICLPIILLLGSALLISNPVLNYGKIVIGDEHWYITNYSLIGKSGWDNSIYTGCYRLDLLNQDKTKSTIKIISPNNIKKFGKNLKFKP